MTDLKALQKKITTLLYTQLQQYFKQVQILSYKPSADGKVSGKFIGDRRNYSFVLSNNQLQYLPSTQTKLDSALAVVQCSGSNHPCKGEKGTRCVPDSQSCKQKESSPEGIARLKEISDTSKEITALVAPNKTKPNEKSSPNEKAPELDQDISLYDFMKFYSPWRAKGSEGFDKAKLRDVKRRAISQTKIKPESKKQTEPKSKVEPESKTKQEPETKQKEEPKKETTPYDFLGVNPKDFPDEASLYKASKAAYRNLAAKYHPDKGGDPKMMTELNRVMDKLKAMRRDSLRISR
jgi:hypothetical protein